MESLRTGAVSRKTLAYMDRYKILRRSRLQVRFLARSRPRTALFVYTNPARRYVVVHP
jgi:hypothetical protein